MKNLMIVAFVSVLATCLQAQKMKYEDVPATVKTSFQKAYSGKDAEWEKEGNNYEASFKQNGKETSIVLDASGKIIETEVEIDKKELPMAILNTIKNDYQGYDLEEAARIESNGVVTYEAEIEKGEKTIDLIFDSQGKLLKIESKDKEDKD